MRPGIVGRLDLLIASRAERKGGPRERAPEQSSNREDRLPHLATRRFAFLRMVSQAVSPATSRGETSA